MSENQLTINLRAIIFTGAIVLFLAGYGQSLPDLRGNYYFTTSMGQKVSSTIYSPTSFQLKTGNGMKQFKIVRVIDKLRVMDIVTYFAEVMVKDLKTQKERKMELVLVENETIGRLRLELDTGEEWVRLVPNASDKESARRE